MAEQKDGSRDGSAVGSVRDEFAGAEAEFEDVAVSLLAVVFGSAADGAGVLFDESHGGVDGGGIFAGGLLLD